MKYDIEKDFLPVGSVVSVRFNENKFMIIGFCTIDNNGKMHDYSAVYYPFGLVDYDNVIMFNKDLIKKVHYVGMVSDEDVEFKNKLHEAIQNNSGNK